MITTYKDQLTARNLPKELKDMIETLIFHASGSGFDAIQSQLKLKKIFSMSDSELVNIYQSQLK